MGAHGILPVIELDVLDALALSGTDLSHGLHLRT